MSLLTVNETFSRMKTANRRKICPVHYHNEYELYYLISGNTKYFIGDEIFSVEAGNFVFVPKGMFHHTDSENCLNNERIVISFDDSIFYEGNRIYLERLLDERVIFIPKKKLPKLEEILYRIEREKENCEEGINPFIIHYIIELIMRICELKGDYNKFYDNNSIVHKTAEYISANYSEDLSLEQLGYILGVSRSHLSRSFKREMGMGLTEYITYVRLLNGERLLKETNLSVTEVATLCGYNDSNYFSTTFKKMRGITPLKFRAMGRK